VIPIKNIYIKIQLVSHRSPLPTCRHGAPHHHHHHSRPATAPPHSLPCRWDWDDKHAHSAHGVVSPHHSTVSHWLCVCVWERGPVWYSFMSGFTTSVAKQPALCLALWSASLKTLSHGVKHTVKLQKHDSPPLMKLLMKLFSKKRLYWWSWVVPNRAREWITAGSQPILSYFLRNQQWKSILHRRLMQNRLWWFKIL
jgi:hypothetical protein